MSEIKVSVIVPVVTDQNQEKIISFVGESIKRQTDVTISLAVEHKYRLKCIYYSAASRLCWGKLRTSLVEKKKTLRLFLRKIRAIKKYNIRYCI